MTQAVGTIGAVIMPHNLYLHSGLVLSRKIDRQSPTRIHDATWYNFIESGIELLLSFFINLAIVASNADNFFDSKCAQADHGPLACAAGAPPPADPADDPALSLACASGFDPAVLFGPSFASRLVQLLLQLLDLALQPARVRLVLDPSELRQHPGWLVGWLVG